MRDRRTIRAVASAVALFALSACPRPGATAPPPRAALVPGWLKGQTHVHTGNSPDSSTPPAEVARWYAAHGFDFIVLTDHNHVTELPRVDGMWVIPGAELTVSIHHCEPPPPPGLLCLLHTNALFVTRPQAIAQWRPPTDGARLDIYAGELALAGEAGALAQLNHPNFMWGANAEVLAELTHRGLRFFEVANQQNDSATAGDATHPSTEALWDDVLNRGGVLYGMATDDAHHYADAEAVRARGDKPLTGDKGWVMVHAAPEPAAIRRALERGEFYATSGVLLSRAGRGAEGQLEVEVAVASPSTGPHHFTVFSGGKAVAESDGRALRFPLAPGAGPTYYRATVTDSLGHKAWVQPLFVGR
jgi:hypothetical protein